MSLLADPPSNRAFAPSWNIAQLRESATIAVSARANIQPTVAAYTSAGMVVFSLW